MTRYYRWDGRPHQIQVRDSQRAKVYAAERAAFGAEWGEKIDDGSLEAVSRYVRQVEGSATWRKILKKSELTPIDGGLRVKDGRGCRWARGFRDHVTLPIWARTRPVVLHEMAHAATGENAKHHWPFAAAYLMLVGTFMGAAARDRLKAEFRKQRVRFAPPRVFTPEHWAALRAHGFKLAAAAREKARAE
jgi:hypothetical protein